MAYAYMDITYDDVCTCVYQSIGINRIPMNYKAFGFFFISNRTFLHITLRYCLLNKCCCYFHFYLFLILNKNVFKRKCKRHTQGQTDNARVIGLYLCKNGHSSLKVPIGRPNKKFILTLCKIDHCAFNRWTIYIFII